MQIRGKSRGYNKKEESANIYTGMRSCGKHDDDL